MSPQGRDSSWEWGWGGTLGIWNAEVPAIVTLNIPSPCEHLPLAFQLAGNGNPLQCSCLENPRDGEAWWADVYGVTQSWT